MTTSTNEHDHLLSDAVKTLVDKFCRLSSGLCNETNITVVERYINQSVKNILLELENLDNFDELLCMSDNELVIKVTENALAKRMLTPKKASNT